MAHEKFKTLEEGKKKTQRKSTNQLGGEIYFC